MPRAVSCLLSGLLAFAAWAADPETPPPIKEGETYRLFEHEVYVVPEAKLPGYYARLPKVEPGQDAAPYYFAIGANYDVPDMPKGVYKLFKTAWNEQAEEFAPWLKAHEEVLKKLDAAAKLPAARWPPLARSKEDAEGFVIVQSLMGPGLSKMRAFARLRAALIWKALAERNVDEAVRQCERIFPLADHAEEDATLIGSLVSAANDSIGIHSAEQIAIAPDAKKEHLTALLEAIRKRRAGVRPFGEVMDGEEYSILHLQDGLLSGELLPSRLQRVAGEIGPANETTDRVFRELVRSRGFRILIPDRTARKEITDAFAKIKARANKPYWEIDDEADDLQLGVSRWNKFAYQMLPVFEGAYVPWRNRRMMFDVAEAGMVARLYEIENGKRPASLADLVPQYLAKAPVDIFTGKPVQMLSDEKGWRVLSVGKNKTVEDPGYDEDNIEFHLEAGAWQKE